MFCHKLEFTWSETIINSTQSVFQYFVLAVFQFQCVRIQDYWGFVMFCEMYIQQIRFATKFYLKTGVTTQFWINQFKLEFKLPCEG